MGTLELLFNCQTNEMIKMETDKQLIADLKALFLKDKVNFNIERPSGQLPRLMSDGTLFSWEEIIQMGKLLLKYNFRIEQIGSDYSDNYSLYFIIKGMP